MTHSYLFSEEHCFAPETDAGLSIKMLHCIRKSRFQTAAAFIVTVHLGGEVSSSCAATWGAREPTCSRGCRPGAEGQAAGSQGSGVGRDWAG